MKNQTKEQKDCNCKLCRGYKLGKQEALKQVEKRFIDFTDKGYFIYKSVWEELKAQLEKLK